jgi:hypothetical protein
MRMIASNSNTRVVRWGDLPKSPNASSGGNDEYTATFTSCIDPFKCRMSLNI